MLKKQTLEFFILICLISCNHNNVEAEFSIDVKKQSLDSIVYESTSHEHEKFVFTYEDHKDGVDFCELVNKSSDTSFINQIGEFVVSDIDNKRQITDSVSLSFIDKFNLILYNAYSKPGVGVILLLNKAAYNNDIHLIYHPKIDSIYLNQLLEQCIENNSDRIKHSLEVELTD